MAYPSPSPSSRSCLTGSFLFPSDLLTDHELIRFTLTLTPSLSPRARVKSSAGRERISALIVITAFCGIDIFSQGSSANCFMAA